VSRASLFSLMCSKLVADVYCCILTKCTVCECKFDFIELVFTLNVLLSGDFAVFVSVKYNKCFNKIY